MIDEDPEEEDVDEDEQESLSVLLLLGEDMEFNDVIELFSSPKQSLKPSASQSQFTASTPRPHSRPTEQTSPVTPIKPTGRHSRFKDKKRRNIESLKAYIGRLKVQAERLEREIEVMEEEAEKKAQEYDAVNGEIQRLEGEVLPLQEEVGRWQEEMDRSYTRPRFVYDSRWDYAQMMDRMAEATKMWDELGRLMGVARYRNKEKMEVWEKTNGLRREMREVWVKMGKATEEVEEVWKEMSRL